MPFTLEYRTADIYIASLSKLRESSEISAVRYTKGSTNKINTFFVCRHNSNQIFFQGECGLGGRAL